MRLARAVAVLLLATALTGALTACQPSPPPPPPTGNVTLYGDSISVQANVPIANDLDGAGLTYAGHVFGGEAVCDRLAEMRQDAAATPVPKVVVVAYNGNNVTSCMRDAAGNPLSGAALRARYAADLATVHDIWAPRGVPVVLLGAVAMSPDNTGSFDQVDHVAFDQMLQQAASTLGFTYEDTDPDISPGNLFVSTLPCAPYESVAEGTCTGPVVGGVQNNVVRSSDGLHLCPDTTGPHSSITPDCPVYASGEVRWARHVLHGVQAVLQPAPTTTTTVEPTTTVAPTTTVPEDTTTTTIAPTTTVPEDTTTTTVPEDTTTTTAPEDTTTTTVPEDTTTTTAPEDTTTTVPEDTTTTTAPEDTTTTVPEDTTTTTAPEDTTTTVPEDTTTTTAPEDTTTTVPEDTTTTTAPEDTTTTVPEDTTTTTAPEDTTGPELTAAWQAIGQRLGDVVGTALEIPRPHHHAF